MAGSWSSENVVAEYKVLQANSMAVDCWGKHALLAGRKFLALVDLDAPLEKVKKSTRQSKWEISAVQWSPHASHGHLFASACNQRADICSWVDGSCVQQGSLKAHTRVISDLDWSPVDPNILTTCSVDTYTYLWDVRDYRKPSLSFQAVAGASQVKWNKLNSNLLATTHDGDIRIWDPRKGTAPIQYIAGHLSKIHGLDWSPASEFHLATSSQDCHVKFWDVTNPRQPDGKLPSGSPVWRARYTPFGRGMITVVVPQLRRGENSLFLWHLDDLKQPAHTFVGHTDVVLEFQWRHKTDANEDFQLVTWSKDQSLRIWKIEPQLQKLCGHELDDDSESTGIVLDLDQDDSTIPDTLDADMDTTDGSSAGRSDANKENGIVIANAVPIKGNKMSDMNASPIEGTPPMGSLRRREDIHSPYQPKTLKQEFSLVNIDIPNVTVDEMDAIKRTFTVSAANGKHLVKLTMSFPETYPNNTSPAFQFGKATTIDKETQTKLIKVLRDTAVQHVKHYRSCIEPCLRQLVTSLDSLTADDTKSSGMPDLDTPYMQQTGIIQPPNFLPIYCFQDASVPFPRTSGARFCSTGVLVCFTRRVDSGTTRRTSSAADLTPRALSALSHFQHNQATRTPLGAQLTYNSFNMARSPPSDSSVSISNYYSYKDRSPQVHQKHRTRSKSRLKDALHESRAGKDSSSSPKKQLKTGPVIIYNIACILPISKQLAENYVVDCKNIPEMCTRNAAVAQQFGRPDLVQVWSLAAMATNKVLTPLSDPDRGEPWAHHPFGRKMLLSLIDHYRKIHDVQTLAMLCCVFGQKNPGNMTPAHESPPNSARSPTEHSVYGNKKKFIVQPSPIPEKEEAAPPCGIVPPALRSPYNAYHTIHPADTTLRGWNVIPARTPSATNLSGTMALLAAVAVPEAVAKIKRSRSMSELQELYEDMRSPAEREKENHEKNLRLLDSSSEPHYEKYLTAYADILYRWQLLNKRAELLKYVFNPQPQQLEIEFSYICKTCRAETTGPKCIRCHDWVFQCAICHIAVKGASSFCLICGHGGHSVHMMDWFQSHNTCPTGCGCHCWQDSPEEAPECHSVTSGNSSSTQLARQTPSQITFLNS